MKYVALLSPRGMAAGGIASTQGKYVKGPGDGMSDSVPASIDGTEEAALATGEYVIPADVVSALGNGDNDAGAKVLEQFVARVRQKKTGRTSQPPAINPMQLMPEVE
jgi:hypothetical protein